MRNFFIEKIPHNGLSYIEFVNSVKETLDNTDINKLSEDEVHIFNYTKLNYQRMIRIDKTNKVNDTLEAIIKKINYNQLWMVLTEGWCGDSAQNLPYINKIASVNPLINLRILERDKHLDIMDQYLTNGKSRSIPKLVAFNDNGDELFIWGPRPKEAEELINKLKAENTPKDVMIEKLHLWYGKNRGKALEDEFTEILKNL
jgi:hypothetical protein